jgi:hypothetical protein
MNRNNQNSKVESQVPEKSTEREKNIASHMQNKMGLDTLKPFHTVAFLSSARTSFQPVGWVRLLVDQGEREKEYALLPVPVAAGLLVPVVRAWLVVARRVVLEPGRQCWLAL